MAGLALPSLDEIRQERERRRVRPAGPAALAERASNGRWQHAAHLDLLDEKLVALAEGRIKRLIVTMPPRHGKSQLCSRYFPAWYLGTHPENRVILCSYEAGFAAKWGGEARDILSEHGQLFGVRVSDETSARDDWRLDGREGGMVTAGAGGPITGRGANLLIIDDPVKNARDANSPTVRQAVWDWWQSTALTRLEPDASVLIIQTRWHKHDLAGRLLTEDPDEVDEADDERWEVLNLPALAESAGDELGRKPGDALWPQRWPAERLMRRMRRLGSYVWGALYQQRPTDPEGNYFKRSWFTVVEPERVPTLSRSCRCWDLAATVQGEKGNTDPDFLAGVKVGKGENGKYYVQHAHVERTTPEGVEKTIQQFGHSDGRTVAIRAEQEGAASGKIVAAHFSRLMDSWDFRFTGIPRNSKLTRSGPFNAACERGDVILVAGKWNEAFIEQLVSFPNGAHDDQVDAAVGAYTELAGADEPWDEQAVQDAFDAPGETLDDDGKSPVERMLARARERYEIGSLEI